MNIIEKLIEAQKLITAQLPAALARLKDTSIPLDERWADYTRLVEANILVNMESFGDGYLPEVFGRDRVSLYDDFNMDRGQSRTFPEIWERIVDEDYADDLEAYADPAKRDAWRERILASGLSGFEYDW